MKRTALSFGLVVLALLAPLCVVSGAQPADSVGEPVDTGRQAVTEAELMAVVASHRDGPELAQARLSLESLIADELRDPAHIEPTRHQIRLVAAANAGSLTAAARLVDLGWWSGLRQVSCRRPAVGAWMDGTQTVGSLYAGQIYAQLWLAHRHGAVDMGRSDCERIREHWLALIQRWPVHHPMLLATAVALFSDVRPTEMAMANRFLGRALVAYAYDPLFAGDDLLVMEGRGAAFAICPRAFDDDDLDAARAVFAGAAARAVERGALAGEGVNLFTKCMLNPDYEEEGIPGMRASLSEIETLFAHAGDIARQGRCLSLLAGLRWRATSTMVDDGGRSIEVDYRSAASLCRRAGDWIDYARITKNMAFLLMARPDRTPVQTVGVAETFAEAARAFARAQDAQEQGECLYWQAVVQSSGYRLTSDWGPIAQLYRQAESCFSLCDEPASGSAEQTDFYVSWWRLKNICTLAETLGQLEDRAGAHEMFSRMELQMRGMETEKGTTIRRRLANGLRNYPP